MATVPAVAVELLAAFEIGRLLVPTPEPSSSGQPVSFDGAHNNTADSVCQLQNNAGLTHLPGMAAASGSGRGPPLPNPVANRNKT